MLRSTSALGNGHERAELLVSVARQQRLDGPLRDVYIQAASDIRSEHDRTRALVELLRTERASR